MVFFRFIKDAIGTDYWISPMIVLLRGHIRNSFRTDALYLMIEKLNVIAKGDLKIYISTFHAVQNTISWRKMDADNTLVTETMIFDYFKTYSANIKKIIISDDSKISLVGRLEGNIGGKNGIAPKRGWKNYWYSKYIGLVEIKKKETDSDHQLVVNSRFDLFSNSNNFNLKEVLDFVQKSVVHNSVIRANLFLKGKKQFFGIDNFYLGSINSQFKLAEHFHFHLDAIIKNEPDVIHQEYLVQSVNNNLFSLKTINLLQKVRI